MKHISTLVDDIYAMVQGDIPPVTEHAHNVSLSYSKWHNKREKEREPKVLYFSEIGDPCARKLWFKYNQPKTGDDYDAPQLIKFFYGDMLEELVLNMAEDAGHTVTDRQRQVIYSLPDGWVVRGRIDAIIDGAVVDVKSVTKHSEDKFRYQLVNDPFGYKAQLNGYAAALKATESGFLTIQKELGHVSYYSFPVDNEWFNLQANSAVEIVTSNTYEDLPRLPAVPQSKTSKNKKLGTACSYCPYKKECWKDANGGAGVRTFVYSSGPEFLVDVVDTPRVFEMKEEK